MTGPNKLRTLTAEISDGADGYVVAACVEIPGCSSQGATREEALANLMDAIQLCLDVMWEDWRGRAAKDTKPVLRGDQVPLEFVPPSVRPMQMKYDGNS